MRLSDLSGMYMKFIPKARQKARRYAMQALYGWMISGNSIAEIEQHYLGERNNQKFDVDYFCKLLHEIPPVIEQLDELAAPKVSRPIAEVSPIELSILRVATFELWRCLDVPYKVVINEALELAKMFGAEDSHKFINGALDPIAKELRQNADYK